MPFYAIYQKLNCDILEIQQSYNVLLTCRFSLCLQAASSLEASSSAVIRTKSAGETSPLSTRLNNTYKRTFLFINTALDLVRNAHFS